MRFHRIIEIFHISKSSLGVSVMFAKMKSWKARQVRKELYGPCSLQQALRVCVHGEEGEMLKKWREGKTGGFY